MIPAGGGAIVNIASIGGMGGWPMRQAYSAAKAGVINLTEVLATEWAHTGVRVNAIGPILDCDTEPQNAPHRSDLQSRPTKVSQTMSCHTASRRSGRHELVLSTTATTDLREPTECVA